MTNDMGVDVLAGLASQAVPLAGRAPEILIFDSGLGALTVADAVREKSPEAHLVFAADDAAFPYGALEDGALVARVSAVVGALTRRYRPDLVIVACNTASTLALPALRAELRVPVVGTVPAIKPAAERSLTRHIAVLATAGTIRRAYTAELVAHYASDCDVDLVAAPGLATIAELILRGDEVPDSRILAEIAPCFTEIGGRRTDIVVLACTHFPLITERLRQAAPWPVSFIDPAPAIARRAASLLAPAPDHPADPLRPAPAHRAVFTGGRNLSADLRQALARRGFHDIAVEPVD